MRHENRHGATVSSAYLNADERTGERLQLYASECGSICGQPYVREQPDQHSRRNCNYGDSKSEPTHEASWPPIWPLCSPHPRWHQFGHKQLEAFRTLLTL